jgi:hypothetical protein
MQIVRLTSGMLAHRLDAQEQAQVWQALETPVLTETTPLFTPNDNLKYFILQREQDGYKCTDTVKANGKTFKVRADICSLDEKTLKAVRKAYNKK